MSDTDLELGERFLTLLGGGSAVMYVVAFAVIGEVALEDAGYGVVAGLFGGIGAYLFLPLLVQLSAIQDQADDVSFGQVVGRTTRSPRLGALGFGLETGSIVMLVVAIAFDETDLLLGGGLALLVAVASFAVATVLLDR